MKLAFHPEAEAEIDTALDYYAERAGSTVPLKFYAAIRDAQARIAVDPRLYSPADDALPGYEVRQYLVPNFPYRIIYWVQPSDEILIMAAAHTARRPGYWHSRIDN